MNAHPTLYDTHGGMEGMSRIVLTLYDRVLNDPVLSPYFTKVDMRALVDHQARFLATIMGGPSSYADRDLAQAHRHLGIDNAAFDTMLAILGSTLTEFGFTGSDHQLVLNEMERRRPVIVTA